MIGVRYSITSMYVLGVYRFTVKYNANVLKNNEIIQRTVAIVISQC